MDVGIKEGKREKLQRGKFVWLKVKKLTKARERERETKRKIVPPGRVVLTEISEFQFAPVDRRIYRLIRMKMAYEDRVEDEVKRLFTSGGNPRAADRIRQNSNPDQELQGKGFESREGASSLNPHRTRGPQGPDSVKLLFVLLYLANINRRSSSFLL